MYSRTDSKVDSRVAPKPYKMRTPSLFIQHQITNLRVLAELLAAHVDGLPMPSAVSREALLCRESMLTISVLLPKLEATRQALQPVPSPENPLPDYPSTDRARPDLASSDHPGRRLAAFGEHSSGQLPNQSVSQPTSPSASQPVIHQGVKLEAASYQPLDEQQVLQRRPRVCENCD